MSYPPDEVNGYMISGLGTPGTSRDFTYPTWLYEEIRREIGEYIVTPDLHVKMREKISAKEVQDVVEVLSNCIDIRTEAVKYLMKKQSSEFIMVMFGETDLISHMFWESDIEKVICEGSNAIYQIYEKIDNAAGQLIEEIGDESNIIVMSDHGFQPVERCLSVNRWLADRGYLGLKKCVRSRLSRVSRRMTRVGRRLSWRAFSKEAGDRFLKKGRGDEVADLESSVHWEKTSAYSMGSGGNIFVNLRGREPLGVVEPGEEYENLCKSLKEELMALEDPANGNKVVKDVYFKKEIVHGKYTMEAPDILIEYSEGYGNLARGAMRGRIDGNNKAIVKSLWSGRHEINGILIMQGPDVLKSVEIDGSSIMDVTPTVLQLMGIPIPADMDGRVLTKALDSRFLATHPEEYTEDLDSEGDLFDQEDLSEEDRQKVVQRLRSLGYL
jgi:predicted AlkP superfamily phosphohydrolase/phosphomutase